MNTFFYNAGGLLEVDALGLGVDYSYTAVPVVSDTQIDFYINGTFFSEKFGEIAATGGIGDFYLNTSTSKTVQLEISRYTVESFFLTLFEADKLQLLLTDEMIPPTSTFSLTTTSLEEFLPGLVATYGDN